MKLSADSKQFDVSGKVNLQYCIAFSSMDVELSVKDLLCKGIQGSSLLVDYLL